MRRVVEPELLDGLPPGNPRSVRSRADLRRLNSIFRHEVPMARAIGLRFTGNPARLVELGAGDGTFLLRLARLVATRGMKAGVTLVDRQELVSADTRRAFAALGWTVESAGRDVFEWLEHPFPPVEIMVANLFLHHFADKPLAALLRLAAARTNFFVACEPRRSPLALAGARSVCFLGCNDVTRHDAVVSVRGGFSGSEISGLWPSNEPWQLAERPFGLFSHCFIAQKNG